MRSKPLLLQHHQPLTKHHIHMAINLNTSNANKKGSEIRLTSFIYNIKIKAYILTLGNSIIP